MKELRQRVWRGLGERELEQAFDTRITSDLIPARERRRSIRNLSVPRVCPHAHSQSDSASHCRLPVVSHPPQLPSQSTFCSASRSLGYRLSYALLCVVVFCKLLRAGYHRSPSTSSLTLHSPSPTLPRLLNPHAPISLVSVVEAIKDQFSCATVADLNPIIARRFDAN